jgi:CheY-like chemotaxis protein
MEGAFDLVVTDIQMPGLDGRALGKAIRQQAAKLPVIYVSSQGDNADLDKPEDGFAFVAKPFLPKTLLKVVSLMLNRAKWPA